MTNREYLERRFPEEMNPNMSINEATGVVALYTSRSSKYMAESYCNSITACLPCSCWYCMKRWLERPNVDILFEDNISENINEILV